VLGKIEPVIEGLVGNEGVQLLDGKVLRSRDPSQVDYESTQNGLCVMGDFTNTGVMASVGSLGRIAGR
jgi:hypothetical protein